MTIEHLANFVLQQVEKTPHKTYLKFNDESITYNALELRMKQVAQGFHTYGIRQGDNVCTILDNSPEYIDLWFGLSMLGSVLVPINTHLKGAGLKHIINHSDCQMIITELAYVKQIESVISMIDREITVIVNDTRVENKTHLLNLSTITQQSTEQSIPHVTIKSNDVNNILYTSGTTGPPKGVMLTHENYIHSAKSFANHMVKATADDILFTTLPLFHINAQAHTILASIAVNATIALEKRFSASKFWEQIYDSEATIFNSLGAMIPILCKQPEHELERKHQVRITACAATPKTDWETFEKRFNLEIVEGYGLTETAGFCVTHPANSGKIGSIGQPYPYVQAKVVPDRHEGERTTNVGEFVLKSAQKYFMKGYYKMPEATQEAFKDGWFHTGDQVYEDNAGYFYFVDRQKQAIRRRGENISSWEVEKAVNEHPAVIESAAVGVHSELAEEDVKIYVVLKENETVAPETLLDWCAERLAYFMVPRYIEFVDQLPKTATERVEKYKLKNLGINEAWDREQARYELKRY